MYFCPLAMTSLQNALITATAMGTACALLSVFVVLRRWAFIGEGIAHAGFGGAGTAWILALLLPSAPGLSSEGGVYGIAVVFCIATAVGIGCVTRNEHVRTDTAIGIFLVAALAWGFIAYGIYTHVRIGATPPGWDQYLLGHMGQLSPTYTAAAVGICAVVVLVTFGLGKEIVSYCFDPTLAAVSGVRVGFVHYLLIVLVAITIIAGMRLMGTLLVTALLVLPGATALLMGRRMGTVLAGSAAVGIIAAVGGTLISNQWRFILEGPAVVVMLVGQFAAVYSYRWMIRER
jgi:ABC-type Mn2+/Zn2+ transport system permease subunit